MKKTTKEPTKKPAKAAGTCPRYTPAEFRRLLRFAKDLPDTGREYDLGKFSEVPAGDFITTACGVVRWECDDPELRKRLERQIAEHEREQAPILAKLGKMAFEAFFQKDAAYFRAIALYIECNLPGGPRTKRTTTINGWKCTELYPIKYDELGIKKKRGRAKTAHDLGTVFPLALGKVIFEREHWVDILTGYQRPKDCPNNGYNLRKITRGEVMKAVRDYGGSIEEGSLSRWLTRFKFNRFMAEQPIALKPQKKGVL